MIEGYVNDGLQPIIQIRLRRGDALTTTEAIVDTGTGPATAALRSSLDGFSNDIATFSTSTTALSHSVIFGGAFADLTGSHSTGRIRMASYSADSLCNV